MTRYRFLRWETPEELNPKREINIISDIELIAYYEVIETRKGLPSESGTVEVTVHPKLGEATILTLESDKAEYNSGDPITLTGSLNFKSDNESLSVRNIDLYKNNVKFTNILTTADGTYHVIDTAEDVEADTSFSYQAKFAGDL